MTELLKTAGARHRSNGEGSIYRRADGRWGATVTFPGGRRRTVYAKTQTEVKARLKDLLERRERGLKVEGADQKLADYLRRWLEDLCRPAVRARTYEAYDDNLRRLLPLIGHIKLGRLGPEQIQSAYAELLRSGCSPRSVHHSHAVLRRALNQAVLWGLLLRNPTVGVSPPRVAQPEMKTLAEDQVRSLLANAAEAGDRFLGLWTLLCTTGLRKGEATGLRWDDLDMATGRLTVRRSLQRQDGNGLVFVETKSRQSRRSVQLPQIALDALRRHRALQIRERLAAGPAWEEHELIFTTTTGRPLDPNHVYVSFQRALKRAGLPRVRVHDLRHTAATLLLGRGVHPKLVQDLLGHSTISITLDLYSHVTAAMQAEVAKQMDQLLGDG